eukprot:SAG31_NODE_72_length_27821_cov_26.870572_11_plen_106_part_00
MLGDLLFWRSDRRGDHDEAKNPPSTLHPRAYARRVLRASVCAFLMRFSPVLTPAATLCATSPLCLLTARSDASGGALSKVRVLRSAPASRYGAVGNRDSTLGSVL